MHLVVAMHSQVISFMFLISMAHCVRLNVMLCMLFLHLELVSEILFRHFSNGMTQLGVGFITLLRDGASILIVNMFPYLVLTLLSSKLCRSL